MKKNKSKSVLYLNEKELAQLKGGLELFKTSNLNKATGCLCDNRPVSSMRNKNTHFECTCYCSPD